MAKLARAGSAGHLESGVPRISAAALLFVPRLISSLGKPQLDIEYGQQKELFYLSNV